MAVQNVDNKSIFTGSNIFVSSNIGGGGSNIGPGPPVPTPLFST